MAANQLGNMALALPRALQQRRQQTTADATSTMRKLATTAPSTSMAGALNTLTPHQMVLLMRTIQRMDWRAVPGATPQLDTRVDSPAALRGQRRRSGRSGTILTGDLVPLDIGKRTLLG